MKHLRIYLFTLFVFFLFSSETSAHKLKEKLSSRAKSKTKSKQWFTSEVSNNVAAAAPFNRMPHLIPPNRITQIHNSQECPCDSPSCPPCILAKTERRLHERFAKDAKSDAKTQLDLAKEADLQQKLFAQAQKYADETSMYEDLAKNLTMALQKASSNAEISRTKMIKAEHEAKQLAMKSIRTMTIYPPHAFTHTPDISMTRAGYEQTVIKDYEPQYNIKIGETNSDGFLDPYHQAIYKV